MNYSRKKNQSVLFSGVSSCPPLYKTNILRHDERRYACNLRNREVFDEAIKRRISKVILIARWTYYSTGDTSGDFSYIGSDFNVLEDKEKSMKTFKRSLAATIKKLTDSGIEVLIIHQPPVQEVDARKLYSWAANFPKTSIKDASKKVSVTTENHIKRYRKLENILDESVEKSSLAKTINFNSMLCNDEYCDIGNDSTSFYLDNDHLSNSGASMVMARIAPYL